VQKAEGKTAHCFVCRSCGAAVQLSLCRGQVPRRARHLRLIEHVKSLAMRPNRARALLAHRSRNELPRLNRWGKELFATEPDVPVRRTQRCSSVTHEPLRNRRHVTNATWSQKSREARIGVLDSTRNDAIGACVGYLRSLMLVCDALALIRLRTLGSIDKPFSCGCN
jgi:hypothetical protein